jgi:uncharacterized damage-inducible protein DinB
VETYFLDYVDRMNDLHAEAARAIIGLSQEALDWVPAPEMNSLCVLVVHITGSERYWVGDVFRGDPSGRVRADEFKARGLDVAALEGRLKDALNYVLKALEGATLENLVEARTSPRDGRQTTAGWALMHALEHTAVHVGHMQIMRQLWGYRKEVKLGV